MKETGLSLGSGTKKMRPVAFFRITMTQTLKIYTKTNENETEKPRFHQKVRLGTGVYNALTKIICFTLRDDVGAIKM